FEKGNTIYEEAIKSKQKVDDQLRLTQEKLHLSKPFASQRINASNQEILVYINYEYTKSSEIERITCDLIDDYNKKIEALPSNLLERNTAENELALKYIAELFQNLEWLHPFFDGQGRTDLVLLAKLLSENGFNPSILYNPYFSTFEPLDEWITYLKKGMELWKEESNPNVSLYRS
ncbi:MAG: Fic family protein, partial [Chlamydiota bacterium]